MNISCTHCKTSFVFPDDRVPETKKFKLNCPKCREPINVDQCDDRIMTPEHFPHDATVAFLFVRDKTLAARISLFMKSRGIFVSEARQVHEAIDKVRINYYNILVLEDTEPSRSILDVIKKWNGLRRREVNIILVESASQSLRADEAFYRGVNAVIGQSDTERIEHVLELAMDEFKSYLELWAAASQKLGVRA